MTRMVDDNSSAFRIQQPAEALSEHLDPRREGASDHPKETERSAWPGCEVGRAQSMGAPEAARGGGAALREES